MKIFTIITLIILLLFFTKNLFSGVEKENYTIIKKIEDIEIRQYKSSIYASYIPKNEKERTSSMLDCKYNVLHKAIQLKMEKEIINL